MEFLLHLLVLSRDIMKCVTPQLLLSTTVHTHIKVIGHSLSSLDGTSYVPYTETVVLNTYLTMTKCLQLCGRKAACCILLALCIVVTVSAMIVLCELSMQCDSVLSMLTTLEWRQMHGHITYKAYKLWVLGFMITNTHTDGLHGPN